MVGAVCFLSEKVIKMFSADSRDGSKLRLLLLFIFPLAVADQSKQSPLRVGCLQEYSWNLALKVDSI